MRQKTTTKRTITMSANIGHAFILQQAPLGAGATERAPGDLADATKMAAAAPAAVLPVSFRDIVMLTTTTDECIAWLRGQGLLAAHMQCPRCGPNVLMFEQVRSNSNDGCQWRCPVRRCRTTTTIRSGSFFKHSHLSLRQLVDLTYYWAIRSSHDVIQQEVIGQNRGRPPNPVPNPISNPKS